MLKLKLKKSNKSYLNSVCLLSVLLVAGSAAPALATNYDVSDVDELTTLLNGTDLNAGDTITLLDEIELDWNADIGTSLNNFEYNGDVTLHEGSVLNIGKNMKKLKESIK